MTTTNFYKINDTAGEDFARCMNIYREAFPVYERQPETTITDRIDNRHCSMIAGKKDARVNCFAIIWEFRHSPFVFLDYLAVSQQARGEGAGTALLDYLINNFITEGRHMIMEVEDPDDGDNRLQRIKRIEFYQRFGAMVMDQVTYFLPPLGGATMPLKMKLMILPEPREPFTGNVFDDLIKTIYRTVYNRDWYL